MSIKRVLRYCRPVVGLANTSTREIWLEKVLCSIPDNARILDAGAGTQRYRKFCGRMQYVSQDFGEYDGKSTLEGLQNPDFNYGKLDIVSDITAIPEPDSSFDAVMCIEVLEHLPDPLPAIKEFSRLLKTGGTLILTAPFCSLTHMAPYHFVSGLNKFWFLKHLPAQQLQITELIANGNFFEYVAQEINRVPSMAARYSKTKPGILGLVGMYLVQRMLMRCSRADSESQEVLCFGYQVVAKKA